jgi:hypothetical protein
MNRGAEQVAVGLEHVGNGRGQGRPHYDLDAVDLVGPCPADRCLERFLQGRRWRVMNDQQAWHEH